MQEPGHGVIPNSPKNFARRLDNESLPAEANFILQATAIADRVEDGSLKPDGALTALALLIAGTYKDRKLLSLTPPDFTQYSADQLIALLDDTWKIAPKYHKRGHLNTLLKSLPQGKEKFRDRIGMVLEEMLKVPIPLRSGSDSLENADGHRNHDVVGNRSFVKDGFQVTRYVVGDGSGGEAAKFVNGDELVIAKMSLMMETALSAQDRPVSQALKRADFIGRELGTSNLTVGAMVAADIFRSENKLQKIEIAGVGDSASIGWRRRGYSRRRSRSFKNRGEASFFQMLTVQQNLATAKKNAGEAAPTAHLDDIAAAGMIYASMGDSERKIPLVPETHEIDFATEDEFPDLLILCSDGLKPNLLTDAASAFSQAVNTLLSDYVDGKSSLTLTQIARELTAMARNWLGDTDDITITIIDLV